MSNERQPLLTEEQIQEMLRHEGLISDGSYSGEAFCVIYYLNSQHKDVLTKVVEVGFDPQDVGMDLFLAFLRGKTKRVLNLDRLRADVKAWVDDPDRKYPEWMHDGSPQVAENWLSFRAQMHGEYHSSIYLGADYPYTAASIIGINPDDYFEEVVVGKEE